MSNNLPPIKNFIGKIITKSSKHKIKKFIGRGRNGSVYLAYDKLTESKLALKIVPVNNLQENYLTEARKANRLTHPSAVRCYEVFEYKTSNINCVVFAYDYVEGENLKSYMRNNKSKINITFIERFLDTIFELLHEIDNRKFQHGDLHAGNVLVAKYEHSLSEEYNFRITDFGVRELTGKIEHAKDYLGVAEILRQLLKCIDYETLESRERYIYKILKDDFLKRHLYETDKIVDTLACDAKNLREKLKSLEAGYKREKQSAASKYERPKLQTPFDYPNCEQIGNSHLLLKSLYSDRLLGLTAIQEKSNLVLTGPRGCGKTTVFRALSLEYLMSINKDSPNDLKDYIGIYYRCDDLYFAFPRYDKKFERPESLDMPMHFLTVTLLAIALEKIKEWTKIHCPEELKRKEKSLVIGLWNIFEWSPLDDPSANQLTTLIHKLTEQRALLIRERKRKDKTLIESYFGPEVTLKACSFIRQTFDFLENRPFYFFIDDYSDPKITKDLQANLNRLLMHRTADVFFKLSTESPISFARFDIDQKYFTETREFNLLNLGLKYINDKAGESMGFLEDLFNRRFAEVKNYPVVNLEQLLGSKPRNENSMARTIKNRAIKNRTIRNKKITTIDDTYYAGKETITAMCSGDIHYIIRLVERMVEDNGGIRSLKKYNKIPIPYDKQNNSIRAAAGAFMESIRILPDGPELTAIVTALGNVAHSNLVHKNSNNEGKETPHQASRIEPYHALNLSEKAQKNLDSLLRYSVLIEDPRGKSPRGDVVPRFYLRRYLIPHFMLTFSKRDSLRLENYQIEILLNEPDKFEQEMLQYKPTQEDIFDHE